MLSAPRVAGLAVLALCGWTAADGLRRAGAGAPLSRVHLPWDAGHLPESASDARLLVLRPVSPFARFRDAMSRAGGADGDAFRTAARGVLRWGRNQPGTLLDVGRVALTRWKERHEAGDREVGESLLVEYTARTTHAEDEGIRAWREVLGPSQDPWPAFRDTPPARWPALGADLAESHPVAAWKFLEPSLQDDTLDPRYASHVLALARGRRQPADLGVLRSLAARGDVAPETARDLRSLIVELEARR